MQVKEATAEQREAYRDAIARSFKAADKLDADAMNAVVKMVEAAQERLLGRFQREIGRGFWAPHYLPKFRAAIDELVDDLAKKYRRDINEFLPKAWDVGLATTDAAIKGSGLGLSVHHIDPRTAGMAVGVDGSLITGMARDGKKYLGRLVGQHILTSEGPGRLMQTLASDPQTEVGNPWRSVAYRGQIIARTELSFVAGGATQARMEQYAGKFPDVGLKKRLLVAHVGEWPCPICEEHEGVVYEVDEGPATPLHPNCRCHYISIGPGLESAAPNNRLVPKLLDASVAEGVLHR